MARLPGAESDAYFELAPPGSRLSAAVSPQSRPVAVARRARGGRRALREQYPDGAVPRPDTWGGYRLVPAHLRVLAARPTHRMHDRFRYTSADGAWAVERLGP